MSAPAKAASDKLTVLPSIPHSENAEARAAATRRLEEATGLNDAILERLVRAFYERARRDEIIGHLFDGVQDWEHHIEKITLFWSSVALATGRYTGQPLPAHFKLGVRTPDFERWLALFEQTARELCTEAGVAHLMEKARRIASSMDMAMAVARGELPPKRSPQQTG